MKHRGPGSSLRPAREAARQAARARLPHYPGGPGAAAVQLSTSAPGGWRLDSDQNGRLVAVHDPSGTYRVLAAPDDEQGGE